MIDTRNPDRPSKTFSRSYVAPPLQAHLDAGGTVQEWLAGRTPIASMARISADRLKGDAIGVGRQHKNNVRNSELHNCAVVVHYEDNNITAAKREIERPAFLQMVKDITHGHEEETGIPVRGCIVVERERAYRLPRDFVAFQDALFMAGGGIFIEDTSLIDIVNDGCVVSAGLTAPETGEAEAKKLRKRTARNARDRAEEGGLYGGPRRFGWLGASEDPPRYGNAFIDDSEWPYVARMVKMKHDRHSWRAIAAYMRKTEVPTARDAEWSEQSVKSVVTNPAWWGGRILDGELMVDSDTGEPVIGMWQHAGEEDGITYQMWQAIMADVKSKRLLRGMPSPARGEAGEYIRPGRYLFSPVLRCGRLNELNEICHAKVSGNKASGKNAKYGAYYRCSSPNCKGVGRRTATVDTYLEGLLLTYLDTHFSHTELQTTPWRGTDKLANLYKQRSEIKKSVTLGDADWSDIHDILTRLSRNIKMLESEEQEHLGAETRRNLLRRWSTAKWENMELSHKHDVIRQVFASVMILPVPPGVSDRAPFNPDLLKVSWQGAHAPTPR